MDKKKQSVNPFETLAIIREQFAEEEATRFVMLHMLEIHGFNEDDIPENNDISTPLHALLLNPKRLYEKVQTLDLDVLECDNYLCFKVDDLEGTEDIYFVSPTDVLYLESGCLNY